MHVTVQTHDSRKWETDIALVLLFEDPQGTAELAGQVADLLGPNADWIADAPALREFAAKKGALSVVYGPAHSPIPRVLLVGLGPKTEISLESLRNAVGAAARRCRELKARNIGLLTAQAEDLAAAVRSVSLTGLRLLEELSLACLCALYKHDRFSLRKQDKEENPDLRLLYAGRAEEATPEEAAPDARVSFRSLERMCAWGMSVYKGIALTRDLVSAPSNVVTPLVMADEALSLSERYGFTYTVYKEDQIRELGMGAFAAVFKATNCARLAILEYTPAGAADDAPLVLVGKGITFDSGGISLKPSAKMHEMKSDMAGAAAILGCFAALGAAAEAGQPCSRRVVGVMGSCDNMPGPLATKPGDVVLTYAKKSVEILNTDAEGRLVLCDLLAYAQDTWSPAALVDLATLTGACIVALGTDVAGLFCENPDLAERIRERGQLNGERYWPLPLWNCYAEPLLKTEMADMANIASREGGAIYAAVFLKQFIRPETVWAHLDIAGPAYTETPGALRVPGGTGFGVRTLAELCRDAAPFTS